MDEETYTKILDVNIEELLGMHPEDVEDAWNVAKYPLFDYLPDPDAPSNSLGLCASQIEWHEGHDARFYRNLLGIDGNPLTRAVRSWADEDEVVLREDLEEFKRRQIEARRAVGWFQ